LINSLKDWKMKITKSEGYQLELLEILEKIAKDKIGASKKFHIDLNKAIQNIVEFPYQYRQSIYFNNRDIRDMVFKGYTVVYRIKADEQRIEMITIFNRNKPIKEEK